MLEAWFLTRGPEVFLVTLVLSAARPLAFIMITPLFTRFGLQAGLIRGAILLAFAAPVFPGLYAELIVTPEISIPELALLIVKELLIGALLGLLLGIPLWAVAGAGDMIDFQRGAAMATIVDPGSGDETTPTGTLFFLVIALVLAASGWFTEVLLDLLYDTYRTWPVLAPIPALDAEAGELLLNLLDALLETAIVLAIPLFGPLLITEIAMALAGKYTPQINILFLAMSVKQIVYVILLPLYFGGLVYYMQGEVRDLSGTIDALRGFLSPGEVP